MTTLDLNLQRVADRAVARRPSRVLLWLIGAPFMLIGLVFRFLFLVPMFLYDSVVEGWQAGDTVVKGLQAQARETARRGG